jgi:putative membrane protein
MVRLQAYRTFVAEDVFATAERTGILIFVSAFEHRVEVIADKGIGAVVPKEAWVRVVDLFSSRLRRGEVVAGFEEAIAECGEILRRHGASLQALDRDELGNELRIRPNTDE